MQTKNSLLDYYKEVSSDAPAPGGGSVSAYLITLSIGLYLMSIKVSIKRKRFLALDEEIQNGVKSNIKKIEDINMQIMEYVDKDLTTFNTFMEAYRSKDEQRIKEETINCFYGPYNVLNLLFKAIDVMMIDYHYVVKSIVSDLKISLMNLNVLIDGTKENIDVNLKNIDDENIKELAKVAYANIVIYKQKIKQVLDELN